MEEPEQVLMKPLERKVVSELNKFYMSVVSELQWCHSGVETEWSWPSTIIHNKSNDYEFLRALLTGALLGMHTVGE